MVKSILGALALSLMASAGLAADLVQEPPMQPSYQEPVEVAAASGWYLRGDVGYGFNRSRGVTFFQGSNGSEASFTTASLRDSFTLGAGVGYQINSYLRTDATFDYMFRSKFSGSTVGGGAAAGACVTACTSSDFSGLRAYSLLANAYVDFGSWYAITPYVGGGVGGTWVKWDNLRNTSCNDANPANCDPTVEHGGRGNWRLSWALMAGASFDVTCNLKADVGYRYRRVEGGRMFDFASNGGPGYDKGFSSHEVRGGLRYVFGGCEQAYVQAEVPYNPPVYK